MDVAFLSAYIYFCWYFEDVLTDEPSTGEGFYDEGEYWKQFSFTVMMRHEEDKSSDF